MKRVSLQLGDLFESGPCDLLVLPCSTVGSVAEFVEKRIREFGLPWPKNGTLGSIQQVNTEQIKGLFSLTPRLVYAHSVENNSSNVDAIRSIARELGDLIAKAQRILKVFVPLLGAGAGGLDRRQVWSALSEGFLQSSCKSGELVVLTPSQRIYASLETFSKERLAEEGKDRISNSIGERQADSKLQVDTKRVFISYTAKDDSVSRWVEWFATELCDAGINARLDVWDLKFGMNLPDFMASEISLADRVIIISDHHYAEKANGKMGGVGWETMLIQGDYLSSLNGARKYILITLGPDRVAATPEYLKTSYSVHFSPDQQDPKDLLLVVRELHSISVRPTVRSFSEWQQKLTGE